MIMTNRRSILVAIAAIIMSLSLLSSSNAYVSGKTEIEDENLKITFKKTEKCDECAGSNVLFIFDFYDKKIGKTKELKFPIRMRQIKALKRYKERLIIAGDLRHGGDIVTIVSLDNLKIIDTIWGYDMYLSDDNRYMVYIEHYPRLARAFIKQIVNIYDINASPEENRVDKQYLSSPQYVGIPIYPEENAKNKDVNFSVPDEKEQNGYISPFYFYSQNQRIVFIEYYKDNYYLSVVDISKGIRNSIVLRKELVREALSDEFEEGGVNKFFRVTDIKLEDFFVLSTLENHSKLKNKTIKIRKSLLDVGEKK